jgi:hypothetical protein
MSAGNSLKAMPMIEVDSSTLNNTSYTEITSADGLPFALSFIHIYSASTQNILLSYDGITDHDIIPALENIPYFSPQDAATPNNYVALFSKGTRIYLKKFTAATPIGFIFFAGYYQR